MRHFAPTAPLITVSLLTLRGALGLAFDHSYIGARAVYNPSTLNDKYDFVIVGGGLAGLVLAGRLAEDSSTSVLVLEAGITGDEVIDTINHPANAFYAGLVNSDHDWQWKTQPQSGANNRVMNWPGGKLLGGSSAMNGCYLVRPSKIEIDAWHDLLSGLDGADNWTSDKFFAAMDKSETFTPPSDAIQATGNIHYVASSHGSSGPIHATYPAYMPEVLGRWTDTLANVGIHTSSDPSGGDNTGAFVTTSTINPTNWTRSYSKTAYIDPFYRPNLHILTEAPVTRLIFSDTKATAVEYGQDRKTVNVGKEVIVSGGPIGSPAMLMRSGVGPKDVLDAAGVTTVVELPGVGQHLQDHLASAVTFTTNVETAGSVHANTQDPRATTPEFLSYVNDAIAYVTASELIGDASIFSNELAGQIDSAAAQVPSSDSSVIAGFKAVYQASTRLLTTSSGQVEILLSLTGNGIIAVQAAVQRPFSQGRLYINSSNPFDPPVIDPHYMANPADLTLLREGLKIARSIGQTEPLNASITGEQSPGANITSDADWDAWILNDFHTEYHPGCSCSMLPKDQGGVVDAHLKVYGLDNVRVVDSSVFPIEFAAHMMAPTYGLAEQAADIIKAQYSLAGSGNSGNGNGGSNGGSGSGNGGSHPNSALPRITGSLTAGFVLVGVLCSLL
ncbi:SubName: Full=Related to Glucose oxidase {ECO:0000313/EMBL:CCA74335.1} [Serendipita indica DSM 11827]|uniref:Related to Glucose oxidase n=1 Tax=Serendipita indica (strain DSM 11827) TaxID=1109443 RepID=G4TSP2_SERID|nr:SubName: Full=Related to Glucose oxidase {ECO:0000313/EMBL:CCA74335.1} [Serendipita indica DSM 11827]CCA74335.1 related to Glucose oxidase [Serendipita indica DSM 11827]